MFVRFHQAGEVLLPGMRYNAFFHVLRFIQDRKCIMYFPCRVVT